MFNEITQNIIKRLLENSYDRVLFITRTYNRMFAGRLSSLAISKNTMSYLNLDNQLLIIKVYLGNLLPLKFIYADKPPKIWIYVVIRIVIFK